MIIHDIIFYSVVVTLVLLYQLFFATTPMLNVKNLFPYTWCPMMKMQDELWNVLLPSLYKSRNDTVKIKVFTWWLYLKECLLTIALIFIVDSFLGGEVWLGSLVCVVGDLAVGSNPFACLFQSNSSFTSQVNCIQGNEPKCCLAWIQH